MPYRKPEGQRHGRHQRLPMLKLPAGGRSGPPPKWPIWRDKPGPAERRLWKYLWTVPQAVAWELMMCEEIVARYVVLLERSKTNVRVLAEVRQMEDRLGLNPRSMAALRWEIVEGEVVELFGVPDDPTNPRAIRRAEREARLTGKGDPRLPPPPKGPVGDSPPS